MFRYSPYLPTRVLFNGRKKVLPTREMALFYKRLNDCIVATMPIYNDSIFNQDVGTIFITSLTEITNEHEDMIEFLINGKFGFSQELLTLKLLNNYCFLCDNPEMSHGDFVKSATLAFHLLVEVTGELRKDFEKVEASGDFAEYIEPERRVNESVHSEDKRAVQGD